MAHKRSISWCSFTSTMQVVTVLTSKLEVDQSMQPCLLKNSPRSIVLLLLMRWQKLKRLYWLCVRPFIITRVYYLYPEPKHESYSNTTYYNSWNKRKLSNLIITWTPIFLIHRVRHISLAPLKYSPLTSSADVIHKIANSDITSKSADTNSHLINYLMT